MRQRTGGIEYEQTIANCVKDESARWEKNIVCHFVNSSVIVELSLLLCECSGCLHVFTLWVHEHDAYICRVENE